MSAERILLDTNIFVYATDETSPHHPAASALLRDINAGRFVGHVTPQILFEFISVVTNPKRVATARTAKDAWDVADQIAASLTVLTPPPHLFARASALGHAIDIGQQDVFDLAHALTAQAAGISRVYSYDTRIFSQIPGIQVTEPDQ